MTKIELKPCQFCAAPPITGPANPDEEGDAWAFIECANVKCKIKPRIEQYSENGTQYCLRKAAKIWNTRASQWQPIETAPKDGTRILLHDANSAAKRQPINTTVGSWWSDKYRNHWFPDHGFVNKPTHWMPLPELPK